MLRTAATIRLPVLASTRLPKAHPRRQGADRTPRGADSTLDPQGRFVFAAGVGSGRLSAYAIDHSLGKLTFLDSYEVGKNPMWVLAAEL